MRSVWVSGPVTGHFDLNRPAFEDARRRLMDLGLRVILPHDLVPPTGTWEEAMRISIGRMLRCDAVAYLPGWRESRGAALEVRLARAVGMETASVRKWEERYR